MTLSSPTITDQCGDWYLIKNTTKCDRRSNTCKTTYVYDTEYCGARIITQITGWHQDDLSEYNLCERDFSGIWVPCKGLVPQSPSTWGDVKGMYR